MKQRRSIRFRLTAVFAISIGILTFAFSIGISRYSRLEDQHSADGVISKAINRFHHEYSELVDKNNISPAADEVRRFCRYDSISVTVFDRNWKLIDGVPGGITQWPSDGVTDWRGRSIRVDQNHNVVFGVPWSKTEEDLNSDELILMIASLLLTILGAFGAWALVGRTLSPIAGLSTQARTAFSDDLTIHLKSPSDDAEIVGLVDTLNDLLLRISETSTSKGRFYSAASHELSTPLQALSGHLELALTKPRTAEEYRAGIEEASKQASRLRNLIEDLLRLYRLDKDDSRAKTMVYDLSLVCANSVSDYQSLMKERELKVSCTVPTSVSINSARTQIDVLVRKLVENAVRYADIGGKVSIRLSVSGSLSKLEIFNECRPIPEWDTERLFEPFTRLDSSRNSQTGGTGLGLAICRSIAIANQWELRLDQVDGGICATVTIPVFMDTIAGD